MTIGVISDTHGYFDPALPQLLEGVERILHAGDVGSAQILDQLSAIAPVQAVRGNVDAALLELSPTLTVQYDGIEIHMLHELPRPQSVLDVWARALASGGKQSQQYHRFLESFPEHSRVIIFGHSHEPCLQILEGKLFFNPGSAGRKRFSLPRCCVRLEILPEGVRATFLSLERYNDDLPGEAWLPRGGL
jgi:putative phosphoesterase